MVRYKKYNYSAQTNERRLIKAGYQVEYHWKDKDERKYECVTVTGPLFRGYGKDFQTPKHAWDYVRKYKMD